MLELLTHVHGIDGDVWSIVARDDTLRDEFIILIIASFPDFVYRHVRGAQLRLVQRLDNLKKCVSRNSPDAIGSAEIFCERHALRSNGLTISA